MATGTHIYDGIGRGKEVAVFSAADFVSTEYDLGLFFIDVPAAGDKLKVEWANGSITEETFINAGPYPVLAKKILFDAFNNITTCSVII